MSVKIFCRSSALIQHDLKSFCDTLFISKT